MENEKIPNIRQCSTAKTNSIKVYKYSFNNNVLNTIDYGDFYVKIYSHVYVDRCG